MEIPAYDDCEFKSNKYNGKSTVKFYSIIKGNNKAENEYTP